MLAWSVPYTTSIRYPVDNNGTRTQHQLRPENLDKTSFSLDFAFLETSNEEENNVVQYWFQSYPFYEHNKILPSSSGSIGLSRKKVGVLYPQDQQNWLL